FGCDPAITNRCASMTSTRIVQLLLGATPPTPSPFGSLTVGEPGRSLTITLANAGCIQMRMPAGTAPTFLPAGNLTLEGGCNSIPTNIPTDKKGKWQNVLLGQTITLAFNIRFDTLLADGAPTGLGNLKLCPSMTTMGSLPG